MMHGMMREHGEMYPADEARGVGPKPGKAPVRDADNTPHHRETTRMTRIIDGTGRRGAATYILGDGGHAEHRLFATKVCRDEWHCEERVDDRLVNEKTVGSMWAARRLLTEWGAMKLWECSGKPLP